MLTDDKDIITAFGELAYWEAYVELLKSYGHEGDDENDEKMRERGRRDAEFSLGAGASGIADA